MGLQTIFVGERYKSLVEDLPKVSSVSPAKNLSCCIFIFMLQMGIIFLIFSGELPVLSAEDKERGVRSYFEVYTPTFSFFITRVICAILLHMQLEGEVRRSLSLFNFARINVKPISNGRFSMLLVSFLQLISAILVEIFNIYIICK